MTAHRIRMYFQKIAILFIIFCYIVSVNSMNHQEGVTGGESSQFRRPRYRNKNKKSIEEMKREIGFQPGEFSAKCAGALFTNSEIDDTAFTACIGNKEKSHVRDMSTCYYWQLLVPVFDAAPKHDPSKFPNEKCEQLLSWPLPFKSGRKNSNRVLVRFSNDPPLCQAMMAVIKKGRNNYENCNINKHSRNPSRLNSQTSSNLDP